MWKILFDLFGSLGIILYFCNQKAEDSPMLLLKTIGDLDYGCTCSTTSN